MRLSLARSWWPVLVLSAARQATGFTTQTAAANLTVPWRFTVGHERQVRSHLQAANATRARTHWASATSSASHARLHGAATAANGTRVRSHAAVGNASHSRLHLAAGANGTRQHGLPQGARQPERHLKPASAVAGHRVAPQGYSSSRVRFQVEGSHVSGRHLVPAKAKAAAAAGHRTASQGPSTIQLSHQGEGALQHERHLAFAAPAKGHGMIARGPLAGHVGHREQSERRVAPATQRAGPPPPQPPLAAAKHGAARGSSSPSDAQPESERRLAPVPHHTVAVLPLLAAAAHGAAQQESSSPSQAYLDKEVPSLADKVSRDVQNQLMRSPAQVMMEADSPFTDSLKGGLVRIIFGIIFVLIAVPIMWFNEERSVRMDTMLSRGTAECLSVDADDVQIANRGRLVHVQGNTIGCVPVVDNQFKDARVEGCLKLQSTVEVCEWVQTTRMVVEGNEKRSQPRFHSEWTTVHHDSIRFRKPSPENPRLPTGLSLGTFTKVCSRVQLGGFLLPEEMVTSFVKFVPAMDLLPSVLHLGDYTFYANQQDGYFYMRPNFLSPRGSPGRQLFDDHSVGDVRVRFMCVKSGLATVVGVQCERDGAESFVPYRPIARPPCLTELQERQRLIEEGDRPLKDLKRELACCTGGGVASCCCCACNVIACCCKEEVVTEEIFYVSDKQEPAETAFTRAVTRNPCRVWNFRLLGLGSAFVGMAMVLTPLSSFVQDSPSLKFYGGGAALVLSADIALAAHAAVLASAYACYRPFMTAKWVLVTIVILALPHIIGRIGAA